MKLKYLVLLVVGLIGNSASALPMRQHEHVNRPELKLKVEDAKAIVKASVNLANQLKKDFSYKDADAQIDELRKLDENLTPIGSIAPSDTVYQIKSIQSLLYNKLEGFLRQRYPSLYESKFSNVPAAKEIAHPIFGPANVGLGECVYEEQHITITPEGKFAQ